LCALGPLTAGIHAFVCSGIRYGSGALVLLVVMEQTSAWWVAFVKPAGLLGTQLLSIKLVDIQIPLHWLQIPIQKGMINNEEWIIKLMVNGSLLTTTWAIPGNFLFLILFHHIPGCHRSLQFLKNTPWIWRTAASAPDPKVWKVVSLEFDILIKIMTWELQSSVSHLPYKRKKNYDSNWSFHIIKKYPIL
jgi:hypothetical protein